MHEIYAMHKIQHAMHEIQQNLSACDRGYSSSCCEHGWHTRMLQPWFVVNVYPNTERGLGMEMLQICDQSRVVYLTFPRSLRDAMCGCCARESCVKLCGICPIYRTGLTSVTARVTLCTRCWRLCVLPVVGSLVDGSVVSSGWFPTGFFAVLATGESAVDDVSNRVSG